MKLELSSQSKKLVVKKNIVNSRILFLIFFLFLGELCKSKKVFFHTDAAQAVGKIKIDVNDQNIDLMSISGHKLYGPKGEM